MLHDEAGAVGPRLRLQVRGCTVEPRGIVRYGKHHGTGRPRGIPRGRSTITAVSEGALTILLWGSTHVPRDQTDMVNTLKGSVGTMELVAMELKQSGCYVARTLSYQVGTKWKPCAWSPP